MKKIAGVLIGIFLLYGCAMGPQSMFEPRPPSEESVTKEIKHESSTANRDRDALVTHFEKEAPQEFNIEPVMPKYDPLEDHRVSFSMMNEDLQVILYSLAQSVGMNLIIDPTISQENQKVTLNFHDVSAATVLREVLNAYDLYYEVDHNVIRVRPYQEKTFRLSFLNTDLSATFDVGGNVLGAAATEATGGLSGNFKLSGKMGKKTNVYDLLEDMLKKIHSEGGKYSLNRVFFKQGLWYTLCQR